MYEIFEKLLTIHNITPYKVSKETGIGQPTFTAWKNGTSKPSPKTLEKLAKYFGVSIDYLLGRESEESEEKKYYLDDETIERLQSLKVNDKLRILFDASRKLEPSDIDFVISMVQKLKKEGQ
ncbi:MAG: hypothetical protein K0S04_296 [Herbinix sp.]|jgi:transcriptional regulator with XRE-family HTH domain|nr:hypothetical protein [Herbinix sp.]